MIRRLALVLVLSAAPAVFMTLAQSLAPTAGQAARIRVQAAGPAVFAADGNIFAVGVGQQLQLYDLSAPANPRDLVSIPLQGRALALGGAGDVVLAAVSRPIGADEIIVVAPDPFRRGLPGIVNALQSFESVRQLVVAADARWAVALYDDGYQMLRLTSPDRIESSTLVRTAHILTGAALTGEHLLLAQADSTRIDQLPLQLAPGLPTATDGLDVSAPVTALAVAPDAALAAATLDDDTLILFDPETMTQTAAVPLEDGPATALRFATSGDNTILIVQIDNRPAVMLFDVSTPADVSLPGSAGIGPDGVVGAVTAAGPHFALVDTETVVLFTLE